MFAAAYLPLIKDGNAALNGNWELTYIEALMAIGVFNGDSAAFRKGVDLWRRRVPAYLYLRSDGDLPIRPSNTTRFDTREALLDYWHNPRVWPDGLCQETCRDLEHVLMGLAALINAAEIAWRQGLDLYAEEALRITTAMEFHAGLLLGQAPPSGLCGGRWNPASSPSWKSPITTTTTGCANSCP